MCFFMHDGAPEQLDYIVGHFLVNDIVKSGFSCIINIVTTSQNNLRAVSYTHLDVYKRQCLYCRNIKRGLENCTLAKVT